MAHYPLNHHLRAPYRFLAGLAGLYLALVGALGVARTWGDPFLHRGSDWVLGLRVNSAAGWLSLLVGLVVLGAAVLGGNVHHRVNLVLGWGVLVYAMLMLTMIQTDANVLNLSMVNIIVLAALGLIVLAAALYGNVGEERDDRAGSTVGAR